MTAILESDPPPLLQLQPNSPPALDYAVQTCLEKNPDQRFQSAHDLKLQLAWVGKSTSQASAPALTIAKRNGYVLWAVALVLSAAVLALAAGWWFTAPARPVFRTNLLPPEGARFATMYRNGAPALSPDGTRVVFLAHVADKNSLWLRSFDKLDAIPLHGTDDAYFPFWSPDGTAVAFFMHGKLWRMELNGGSPVMVCDAPEARGGSWGSGNMIVFAPVTWGPIAKVRAEGGAATPVTKTGFTNEGVSDRWPFFLPDGKHFLYMHTPSGDAEEGNEVHFAALDGSEDRALLKGKYYTVQYASGRLLADGAGSLLAWKFSPSSGKVSGDPVTVVERIASDDITAGAVFSVSTQGVLLYQEGMGATGDRHVWVDATGKQLSQISDPSVYGGTRLSPDDARIATPWLGQTGEQSLWMWDLAGGARARLSGTVYFADSPVWSADGRTIYFAGESAANTPVDLRAVPADGSQPEQVLIKTQNNVTPADCTRDGKWLLYEELNQLPEPGGKLKAYPLVKGLEPFTVVESLSRTSNARLKPDTNDWLAYQSNVSGRPEIYLTRFPHPGAKYQVSQSGASQAVWSRDGKKLYYLDLLQRLTAVDIQTSADSVQIGVPKTQFQTGVRSSILNEGYDVARNGKFLMVDSVVESTSPVVLVTNWDAELRK